jgi:hypothetical protein
MSYTKEGAIRELKRRGYPVSEEIPVSDHNYTKEGAIRELRRRGIDINSEISPEEEFNMPRYLAEQGAQGALSIVDLPQIIGESMPPVTKIYTKNPKMREILESGGFGERGQQERISEKLKRFLKEKGYNIESQTPKTALQRILGKGSQFAGSMLGGAGIGSAARMAGLAKTGSFLGAPQGINSLEKAKELAKMTGIGGLGGTAAGGLEEVGVPEPIANITGALAAPFIPQTARHAASSLYKPSLKPTSSITKETKAQKLVREYLAKEIGAEQLPTVAQELKEYMQPEFEYTPTLAEITTNPRLKELQRVIYERKEAPRLKEAVEQGKEQLQGRFAQLEPKIEPEATVRHLENMQQKAIHGREKSLEGIKEFEMPHMTGEKLRGAIEEEGKSRVAAREELAGEKYRAIKEMKNPFHAKNTLKFIENESKDLAPSSGISKILNKTKKLFNKEISAKEKEDLTAYKNALPLFDKKPENYSIQMGNLGRVTKSDLQDKISKIESPSIAQLEKSKQEIGDKIHKAKHAKEFERARTLRNIRDKLDEELEHIPEIKEAAKLWRIGSEPVNKVYEDPLIGKVLKTTKKGNEYKLGASQVSTNILKPSMKTHDGAERLLDIIGKDKGTIDTIQKYINNDLVSSIVDLETGRVSLAKLDSWKKKYPYADKFYPHLNKKLNDIKSAQYLVNNIERVNNRLLDNYYNEAASFDLGGRSPDLLMARILKSKNKYKDFDELMDVIAQDKTGAAKEGIKKSFYRYIKNHTKLAGDEVNVRVFNDLMSHNMPIIEKLLDKNQIQSLNEIRDIAQRRYDVRNKRLSSGSRTSPLAEETKSMLELAGGMTASKLLKLFGKFTGIPGVNKAYDFVKNVGAEKRKASFLDALDKVFSDPKEAEILLSRPFESSSSMKHFIKLIEDKHKSKPYFISPIVLQTSSKEENNE